MVVPIEDVAARCRADVATICERALALHAITPNWAGAPCVPEDVAAAIVDEYEAARLTPPPTDAAR